VLLALAYPPARLLAPAFVGLVPLLVFIAERPRGPAGRWSALVAGALTGMVYYGLQLYWVVVALIPESALAVPAYVLSVFLLAGFTAAFAWALHYTLERLPTVPLALLAAVLWTTVEWTQARMGDLAFPWLGLGYALAPFPRLAGAADLVGVRGLTLWIATINGLLAMALLRYRAAGAQRALAAGRLVATTMLLAVVPAAYGVWRAATLQLRPAALVAVVQPNISQEIRRDHALALDTSMVMLTRLTRGATARSERAAGVDPPDGSDAPHASVRSVQLVTWPEVALTTDLAADALLLDAVRDLSRLVGAPILAGAYGGDPPARASDRRPVFNSALLVSADGIVGPRYDKRRLVAFVERVPFVGRGLDRGRAGPLFRTGGREVAGQGGAELEAVPGAAFGVLICYESAFGDLARRYRRGGAEFLVNITNDAWFGREPWYARTTALWQHPAHMTMRAIETRMGAARAANTGISMFIDPLGRVQRATPLFVDAVLRDVVLTTDTTTLFVRWGDWLATLAALAAGVLVLAARLSPVARLPPRPAPGQPAEQVAGRGD
jgi:apolipoprotein N-acyltransferase